MYQPEIETMPQDQLRALQSERLVKQVRHVYDNVPYYRAKMDEKGVTPDDIHGIEDLHKLPFVSKADLRECYPYGLLAKPLSECVRIHSTSGTTGRRVVAFYTQHDVDLWEDCCARAIMAAGGTKDDVVHISYGYGLFTGGDDGALLDDKVMGPQDLGGLVGVVDDQAQDAEVGGVGQGEGAHVHAVVGQDLGDLAQLAGLVLDENRDLGDEHRILLLLFRCG